MAAGRCACGSFALAPSPRASEARCLGCGRSARATILVLHVLGARYVGGRGGYALRGEQNERWFRSTYGDRLVVRGRCLWRPACRAYQERVKAEKEAKTAHRRAEIPFDKAPMGTCRWCGVKLVHGRVKTRRWHDGREDEPHCLREFFSWSSPRRVVKDLVERDGGLCQGGCGKVLAELEAHTSQAGKTGTVLRSRAYYEVDHREALIDGGALSFANLQLLCRGCHAAKTGREATARAAKRRADREAARGQLALGDAGG